MQGRHSYPENALVTLGKGSFARGGVNIFYTKYIISYTITTQ